MARATFYSGNGARLIFGVMKNGRHTRYLPEDLLVAALSEGVAGPFVGGIVMDHVTCNSR